MTNKYTLITKTGKVMVFNVKAAAEIFQQAYGGVIVPKESVQLSRVLVAQIPNPAYN